jgi:hypothetical protein
MHIHGLKRPNSVTVQCSPELCSRLCKLRIAIGMHKLEIKMVSILILNQMKVFVNYVIKQFKMKSTF